MKKEVKKENLNLRLSKSRKDSLKASAARQNTTLSDLIFSSLDTMKIKGIKEQMVTVLDNFRHLEGFNIPNYDLKGGDDGGKKDIDVIGNLVNMMVTVTDEMNPKNQGVSGALRKAKGEFKPQQLDSHTNILRKIKNNGKATKD